MNKIFPSISDLKQFFIHLKQIFTLQVNRLKPYIYCFILWARQYSKSHTYIHSFNPHKIPVR